MKTLGTYRYEGPVSNPRVETISESEAIRTARMCVGEGGKNCSIAKASLMMWAIMNRLFLWPAGKRFKEYEDLERAFSQPINPRWAEGGDLAKKWAGTKYATAAVLKRRKWVSTLPWEKIPAHIADAVRLFQAGLLFPPDILTTVPRSRITNWASLKKPRKDFPWGFDFEGEWFFEDPGIYEGIVVVDSGSLE